MSTMDVPLSADDLKAIAGTVESIENRIGAFLTEEGDMIAGIDDVVVSVLRPDTDEVIGEVRWHGDGWFGYYPKGID